MSQELYLSVSDYGAVSGGPWVWRRGLSVRPCGFWQPSCEEARPLELSFSEQFLGWTLEVSGRL